MYKLKTISVRSLFLMCIIGVYGCAKTSELNNFVDLGKKYDVVIERDYLGVPHIIGNKDVDAAFGFAYAQAEDNWAIIHDSIPFYRGTNASINGEDAAAIDFLITVSYTHLTLPTKLAV